MDITNKIQLYVSTPEADMVRGSFKTCCVCKERRGPNLNGACRRTPVYYSEEFAKWRIPLVCSECLGHPKSWPSPISLWWLDHLHPKYIPLFNAIKARYLEKEDEEIRNQGIPCHRLRGSSWYGAFGERPSRLNKRRKQKAAIIIQLHWRGFVARFPLD